MKRLDRLRPEETLLLCCARTHLGTGTAERIRQLVRGELDWSHLLALAEVQRVTPLLYHQLSVVAPAAVPLPVQSHLRRHFLANVRNTLFLAHQLLRLLDLFEAHGISVLPFNGPVAGALAYGNLHLRTFSDLNLLVRKSDLQRAQEVLRVQQVNGSGPPLPEPDDPAPWLQTFTGPAPEAGTCAPEEKPPDRPSVALQWTHLPSFFARALDAATLWEHRHPISLMGRTVPTFAPKDTLVYFCLYGTHHRWSHLRLACDVAEMMRTHPKLDWGATYRHAEALPSGRPLLLGLYLACELLEAPLPEAVRRQAYAGKAVASIGEQVCAQLFQEKQTPPDVGALAPYDLPAPDLPRDDPNTQFPHLHLRLAALDHNA